MLQLQPGFWAIPHRPADNAFSWLDTEAIGRHCRLSTSAPIVLIESVDPAPTKQNVFPLTKQLQTLAETYVMPSTHLVYAATWYTLSLFGAAIAYYRFKKPIKVGGRRR